MPRVHAAGGRTHTRTAEVLRPALQQEAAPRHSSRGRERLRHAHSRGICQGGEEHRDRAGGPARRATAASDAEGYPVNGDGRREGQGDHAERDYAWDLSTALVIGPFTGHAIRGWWRRHQGGAGDTCVTSDELRRIAGCGGHRTVTVALREWLRGHEEDSDTISSAHAFRWLSCAEHARQCARVSEVSLNSRGPSSKLKRPAIAERYRVGRAVHKAFNRMQRLRRDDGLMIHDPAWSTRCDGTAGRSYGVPHPPCRSSQTQSSMLISATGA